MRKWLIAIIVAAILLGIGRISLPPNPRDEQVEYKVYLPHAAKSLPRPDARFGIAEHTPEEAEVLGFDTGRYLAGQWRLPLEGDTVVFPRPTERPHWSTWKLCSWSARDGWYDEGGCRDWIQHHPGMDYIVGNELGVGGSVGDGHWVSTDDYARWYYEAWNLIKGEDPTAIVAPYGPVGQTTAGRLLAVWDSYQEQFGSLLQVDFYPVHHYCQLDDEVWWCWTKLTHWIGWLENHRGTHWSGPKDYWLTEWGLMAWDVPVPEATALTVMEGMLAELSQNTLGITLHSWWPSGNDGWPNQDTWLVKDGQVTVLGQRYYELAIGGR